MRSTRPILGWLLPVLVVAAAVWPIASRAQPSEVDPDAIKLLRRATDYLSDLKQFRMETDTTIEAVLSTGQKLQFGHREIGRAHV